ncbi:MAG: oxygenase MpaB family protein, partial [Acidimicrobiales bacterium]
MTERRWDAEAVGAPLGPGSLLWGIAGDPRSLLTGSAAGIMQLMLPGLGAGVTEHSNFFDDPLDRIYRSVPLIWGSIFSDDEAGAEVGRTIRDKHPEIKGTDEQGRRYHALDPDVYWWAHATFTWEMFRARALYHPFPLRRRLQEQLYAETVTWYRRYGVSDRPVPPTLRDFEARFDDICRHELELTPAVAWVFDREANPASKAQRVRLADPLRALEPLATHSASELLRLLVYGAMPDVVRRRFDLPWSNADRAAFAGVVAAVRAAAPLVARGAL